MNEVLSMLEDDTDFQSADIYLESPPADELTDEDSGEEDGGGTVDNLNGRQLSAGAEVTIVAVVLRYNHFSVVQDYAETDHAEPDTAAASTSNGKRKQPPEAAGGKKRAKTESHAKAALTRNWRKADLSK